MLTFLLPLLFVGSLMFLNWQLNRPVKHLPPAFYRPVESAKDVDPEELEWIRRRNEAQLAKTRQAAAPPLPRNDVAHVLCEFAGHEWYETAIGDRCQVCGLVRFPRFPAPQPDRSHDRHVAFPDD